MKIKVESCWITGEKFNFRLTLPNGKRLLVPALVGHWHLGVAKRALNALEDLGFDRRAVRFTHV